MSRGQRQDNLSYLPLRFSAVVAEVTKSNRNKTTIIIIAILLLIIPIYAVNRVFSAALTTGSEKFNEIVVVHTLPTVEPLDPQGVYRLNGEEAGLNQSTQIEVNNGEVKATVNGHHVPINENGTTQVTIPNSDGSTTNITSTSSSGTASNSTNFNSNMNSISISTQSNNFTSSFSHVQQTGNGEVQ